MTRLTRPLLRRVLNALHLLEAQAFLEHQARTAYLLRP